MRFEQLYSRVRAEAEKLGKHGSYLQGRRTGDDVRDAFLRKVRLHRAALERFSQAEQKEWAAHVNEVNKDLFVHWHRQAYEQRARTRKLGWSQTLPVGLQRRHFEQGEARARRISAIETVCDRLRCEGTKPTIKAVSKRLGKDFPELLGVRLDTLRKDMRSQKVACQSR